MVWQKSAGRLLKYVMIKFKTTCWHDLYGTSLYRDYTKLQNNYILFLCKFVWFAHGQRTVKTQLQTK